mmetsp:Transcript_20544/g.30606  ORF Transcript_20544/g.30606 Transcript_20544/m.30606 type:complete len:103 (-) Transcript_20544:89-397(-)
MHTLQYPSNSRRQEGSRTHTHYSRSGLEANRPVSLRWIHQSAQEADDVAARSRTKTRPQHCSYPSPPQPRLAAALGSEVPSVAAAAPGSSARKQQWRKSDVE